MGVGLRDVLNKTRALIFSRRPIPARCDSPTVLRRFAHARGHEHGRGPVSVEPVRRNVDPRSCGGLGDLAGHSGGLCEP